METISPNRETPDSILSQTRTGLSQSNTSLTHQSYCYTNQQCYETGCYGYTFYNGYDLDGIIRPLVDDRRPKITAAIYKCTLKRSPSSEDLYLAAAGDSAENLKEHQYKEGFSENNIRQDSIPEEAPNDISLLRNSEEEVREGNFDKKGFEGDTRVQIESKIFHSSIDRVENQTDIVSCN